MAAAAVTTPSRFSLGKKDIGEAKNFSWETAVPSNQFWDNLEFAEARNFLQSISPEELKALPIDAESNQSVAEKRQFLLNTLKEKLVHEDAAASPKTFYDKDFSAWDKLSLAIFTFQYNLGQLDEAEATIKTQIERKKNPSNLSYEYNLISILMDRGAYAEAENLGRKVLPSFVSLLGDTSPQALGAQRVLAQSVWKQGLERVPEAKNIFEGIFRLIEKSKQGKYALYADEEKELTENLVRDLTDEKL